jgi:hypothetical protein
MLHIKVPFSRRGEKVKHIPYLIRECGEININAPSPQSSPPAERGGVY